MKKKKKAQQEIREEHFLLSFLQNKKEDKKANPATGTAKDENKVESRDYTQDWNAYRTSLKTVLKDKGLEAWYPNESKQRVVLFMLLDDGGKGLISFKQFWQLLK